MIKSISILAVSLTSFLGITAANAATINIDASNYYQQMVGFGTCSVGWDRDMDAYYATNDFLTQYVDEMGMNIYRMPIWPEVLTQTVNTASDIKYSMFNTANARAKSYIDQAKRLHQKDPNMKLIMSSWSPPAWMKSNQTIINGGSLLRNRYNHFAYYLLEWCKYMTEQVGMRPYALSFQNELLFVEPYESCVWTVDEYVDFLKVLGPLLDSNGYGDVLIFGPEHMTASVQETMNFVNGIMEDPVAAPYFDVVATHGYTDGVQADSNPQSANTLFNQWRKYPLQYWMTETSGEPVTYDGALDGVAGSIHNSIVGGRASAYVYWQFSEKGASQFSLRSNASPNKKYYAFRHFSKWIRPDSWRVDAVATDATKLDVSAFVSEEEQEITIVLLNRNIAAQTISFNFAHAPGLTTLNGFRTNSGGENTAAITAVSVSNGQASLTIPARSMVTLVGDLSGYVKPTHTTDFTPISVPAGSGDLIVPVSSTDESATWRAEGTVSWLVSQTPTGTGNSDAVVRVSRNTTGSSRTGAIEISGQLLMVTQAPNPGLTFAGYGTVVPSSGGSGQVTVDAFGSEGRNREWTATSSADWLVLTAASGKGAGTISYTVNKNNSLEARTATISLEAETYTITQPAGNGSIFPEIGWMPAIGFYYDGFYPFVYLWTTSEWIYLPEDSTFDGFFFWRFAASHWGYTAGEWLPWYYPFYEFGAGEALDINVPVE